MLLIEAGFAIRNKTFVQTGALTVLSNISKPHNVVPDAVQTTPDQYRKTLNTVFDLQQKPV
jgi:hypothetical protein